MTDKIGALEIPALESGAAADPLLDAFGSYLASYVNSTMGLEWARVAPGGGLPAKTVVKCAIERATFDNDRLPALFVFRQDEENAKLADELFQCTTRLYVVWVPPIADHAIREKYAPMGNGIAKAIKHALRLGTHPDWTGGSTLMEAAGLSEEPRITKTLFDPNIKVRVEGDVVEYDATLVIVECVELTEMDPSLRGVPAQMATSISQGGFTIEVH